MTDENTPEPVAQLIELLDIEAIDTDLYRGPRRPGGVGRVFGGQVIAQALQAAQRSVEHPRVVHSLHAYFMRPGSEAHPIVYRVVRDFDGRSFANRRVIATQQGKAIFNMIASFQLPEDGPAHRSPMPDVPAPETLAGESELYRRIEPRVPPPFRPLFERPRPIEIRPVDPDTWFADVPRLPAQQSWFRVAAPLPDDPALHRAALAYASDMVLLGTCMLPHGINWLQADVQTASLDHALWLHAPVRADDWLLYATDSPWSGHARGLNRGSIHTRDGRLIASVAQEGLIRRRD